MPPDSASDANACSSGREYAFRATQPSLTRPYSVFGTVEKNGETTTLKDSEKLATQQKMVMADFESRSPFSSPSSAIPRCRT